MLSEEVIDRSWEKKLVARQLLSRALYSQSQDSVEAAAALCITEEAAVAADLRSFRRFVRRVMKIARPPSNRDVRRLASDVRRALAFDQANVAATFPMHKVCPEVQLLFDVCSEINRGDHDGAKHHPGVGEGVEVIERVLTQLADKSSRPAFKAARKNFNRSFQKNHLGLVRHLRHLQSLFTRLLTIRVDLSYRKPPLWPIAAATNVDYCDVQL
jgi:hypothetical protein